MGSGVGEVMICEGSTLGFGKLARVGDASELGSEAAGGEEGTDKGACAVGSPDASVSCVCGLDAPVSSESESAVCESSGLSETWVSLAAPSALPATVLLMDSSEADLSVAFDDDVPAPSAEQEVCQKACISQSC